MSQSSLPLFNLQRFIFGDDRELIERDICS
jgi:hypothetical protein